MKPNFALGLTEDGITLWHRDASGWLRVDAVAPDSPTLDSDMRAMAEAAARLEPDRIITKIVVPDDQILYCDLELSPGSPAKQDALLRAQLEGRTPYPVEELEIDWFDENGRARMAVVARETILEAEDFAAGYGFNPVSAVAAPDKARYPMEPVFCTTRTARELFDDPSVCALERDLVREVGVVSASPPAPIPDTVDEPASTTESVPKPETEEAAQAAVSDVDPDSGAAKTAAPAKNLTATKKDTQARKQDTTTPAKPKSDSTRKPTGAKQAATKAAQDRKNALLARLMGAREKASAVKQAATAKQHDKGHAPAATGDSGANPATFRSRRAGATPPPAASSTAEKVAGRSNPLTSLLTRVKTKSSQPANEIFSKAKAASSKASAAHNKLPAADEKPSAAVPEAPSPASGSDEKVPATQTAAPVDASADAAQRKDPLTMLREHGNRRPDPSEAERLTIFGARNQDAPGDSGNKRALLVLGGVALLLVAVAIWAAYFYVTQPAPEQVAEDSAAPAEAEIAAPAEAEPDTLAIDQDEVEAALGLEDAAQQPPLEVTDADMAPAEPAQEPGTETPTAQADAEAGRLAALRSVSLIQPQEAASLPTAPAAPAPFGSEPLPPTRSERAAELAAQDETEIAEETAEPAPSADLPEAEAALEIGVTQGTPAAVPPQRPEGLLSEAELEALRQAAAPPEPEPAEELPATIAEDVAAEEAIVPSEPDPFDESALDIAVTSGTPAATPPERPAGLAPELEQSLPQAPEADSTPEDDTAPPAQAAEDDDQASLTPPPGGVALSALRPVSRPDELSTATAIASEDENRFADASDLAVPASLRPDSRPSQFAAVVQRTLSAAQSQQSTTPSEPVQTARAAAAPSIPTSASVAREATQTRAINLRQVNLIGVMGTSSNRRALVRLSNGRVVTVRVGEQLDGGQVTAIGESELRYTRRGRDVVLRIAS